METPASPDPNPVNSGPAQSSPSETVPPATAGGWLRENLFPVAFTALIVGFFLYKGVNWLDVAKVAVGLGLIIFIHELGHFAAAKWCDVHVETFSIGFGKPIPGCSFKYGETSYKIGWIPLGGYVKMVGEGEGAEGEEAEEDPRSFKNKSVPQRMVIISAGVVMNLLLAGVCFVIAYSHGIEEKPPIIGSVDPGSPSWQAGMHSGTIIEKLEYLERPRLMFDDIRPIVMGSSQGEKLHIVIKDGPDGKPVAVEVEPTRDEDALYPTIGVVNANRPVLYTSRRPGFKPVRAGSPAAQVDPAFQIGDKVVAMTDPEDGGKVTALPDDRIAGYAALHRRMTLMLGKPVTLSMQRTGGELYQVELGSAYMFVPGVRMKMKNVVAVKANSGAANAKPLGGADKPLGIMPGDELVEVEIPGAGKPVRFVSRPPVKAAEEADERDLDPLRLPMELAQEMGKFHGKQPQTVKLTVLRNAEHTRQRVALEAAWDFEARFYVEYQSTVNSPLSIPELGLAYYVEAIVDELTPVGDIPSPAAAAGLHKDDLIKEVRTKYKEKGKIETGKWQQIKPHQWSFIFNMLQYGDVKEFDVRVERGGAGNVVELTLPLVEDKSWPIVDRGLIFQSEVELHKAEDLMDAIGLGWHRTWRTVRVIYQNLYAMIFARVSPFTMSGPLSIATVSYNIAGENFWQFILFLGMINVNLAVINFLPIPALDGGHMVLLIYEGIRGKPAPDSVQIGLQLLGVALILALMAFVIYLDVKRLFF